MTDKELVEILRNYAKSYANGQPYSFNPGLAIMIANRMEQLITLNEKKQNTVESDFNIGDRVWVPDYIYDEWFIINKGGYIVDSVRIYVSSEGEELKMYTLRRDNDFQECPPRLCFKSYEECKEWCDKENGLQ